MQTSAKIALSVAKDIQDDSPRRARPHDAGAAPDSEQVLPFSYVRGTRGYLEKVVNQINGSYENGWFDACAVMIRRLMETLIIEVYEHHGIDSRIKNAAGDFYHLSDLIDRVLAETVWNLSRNTKRGLQKLKSTGDLAAHNRRYTAHRGDIDDRILDDLRVITQEFLDLAGLK